MSGPKTTPTDRINWLVANPDMLAQWPSGESFIKQRMQQAGLISSNTNLKYVDISKVVTAAKRKIHENHRTGQPH